MPGHKVAVLADKPKQPGYFQAKFSAGSCGDGSNLSSGIYIYKLTAVNFTSTKKLIKIK